MTTRMIFAHIVSESGCWWLIGYIPYNNIKDRLTTYVTNYQKYIQSDILPSWFNTKPSVLHYCMFAYDIFNVERSQIIFYVCIITFNVVSRSKSSTSSSSSYYRFLFTSSSYQEDLFLSEVLTTWKLSRRSCIEIYVCTCVCSYNVR